MGGINGLETFERVAKKPSKQNLGSHE